MLNAKLRTQLERIARDVANDHRRRAVIALCELAGIPEIPVGPRREVKAEPKPHGTPVYRKQEPQTAENHKARVEDGALIVSFRLANPVCCVGDCGRKAVVHHIIERSEVRIDSHWNLLNLCDNASDGGHHRGRFGWHGLGAHGFIAHWAYALSPAVIKKIHAALAMGRTLKRGGDTGMATEEAS